VNGRTGPDQFLATIPGWGGASYRELPGGLTNRTLLVEKEGRRAVMKIDPALRKAPYNSRPDEARIQDRAAAIGRATGVLYVADTVLLSEWAEGEVWTRDQFDDDENLERLGSALREIHGLPLTGRTFDAVAAARLYASCVNGADSNAARQHLAVVESAPAPTNLRCCHNDLVADNIISAPAVRFLDWEYACDNDPLFDVAVVVAHHGLSDRQAGILLDACFGGYSGSFRERLGGQVRLYNALNWLWATAGASAAQPGA
jgi:thiamine kinase-like enzyme